MLSGRDTNIVLIGHSFQFFMVCIPTFSQIVKTRRTSKDPRLASNLPRMICQDKSDTQQASKDL